MALRRWAWARTTASRSLRRRSALPYTRTTSSSSVMVRGSSCRVRSAIAGLLGVDEDLPPAGGDAPATALALRPVACGPQGLQHPGEGPAADGHAGPLVGGGEDDFRFHAMLLGGVGTPKARTRRAWGLVEGVVYLARAATLASCWA